MKKYFTVGYFSTGTEVDIPPEVLMSLPSPDEIRFRAERAKAAAQEALSRQAEGGQGATRQQ